MPLGTNNVTTTQTQIFSDFKNVPVRIPEIDSGSQYERDVVKWLVSMGYPCAERAYGAGRHDDVGDIDGIDGVVIECKNEKRINIPGYLKELEDEMIHSQPTQHLTQHNT